VEYLQGIGMEAIHAHEQFITNYALEALSEVPGLRVWGPPAGQRGGVAAFTLEGVHPHDIAELLDKDGIAVRAGHHCAMPLHKKLGVSATTRASFYLHTTTQEIDKLVESLHKVRQIFRLA
jgi:cysteine desulfurase/selenocysteine lyase